MMAFTVGHCFAGATLPGAEQLYFEGVLIGILSVCIIHILEKTKQ